MEQFIYHPKSGGLGQTWGGASPFPSRSLKPPLEQSTTAYEGSQTAGAFSRKMVSAGLWRGDADCGGPESRAYASGRVTITTESSKK